MSTDLSGCGSTARACGAASRPWRRSARRRRAACTGSPLSDEDKRARDLLVSWLEEIGAQVTVDEMGNIFGRRPGKDDALPPVMTGSHARLAAQGGRFDGVLGVMGALEVLRTLDDHDVETERPVDARRLDQRGGLAVRAGHDGLRRLGGRARAATGRTRAPTSPA